MRPCDCPKVVGFVVVRRGGRCLHTLITQMQSKMSVATIRGNRYMEDRHVVEEIIHVPDGRTLRLHAVIDGHGGPTCADFVSKHLVTMFQAKIDECSLLRGIPALLTETYRRLDHAFVAMHPTLDQCGCCCLTVVRDADTCYVANVGDCRCLLVVSDGGMYTKALNTRHDREEASSISAPLRAQR